MNKRNDFTGVNNRVNARGVAFIKSRKSIDNVKTILNDMNNMADANGITLTRAYHDLSFSLDFDRRELDDSGVREEIDRALIRQFDLLPVARKMVMEELANGQQN